MRELRTSNAHRLANVGLGMGLGMGLGLGNEVIFYRRSSPFESLDVTRTHLERNRLENLWLKKNTLTNLSENCGPEDHPGNEGTVKLPEAQGRAKWQRRIVPPNYQRGRRRMVFGHVLKRSRQT